VITTPVYTSRSHTNLAGPADGRAPQKIGVPLRCTGSHQTYGRMFRSRAIISAVRVGRSFYIKATSERRRPAPLFVRFVLRKTYMTPLGAHAAAASSVAALGSVAQGANAIFRRARGESIVASSVTSGSVRSSV
jgi:hypothetical protein